MKKKFENIIKETANDHFDDINPDLIWSGIENKMNKKSKKYSGFWILGGLVLIGIVSALFLFSYDDKPKASIYTADNSDEVNRNTITSNSPNWELDSDESARVNSEKIQPIKAKDGKEILEGKNDVDGVTKTKESATISNSLSKAKANNDQNKFNEVIPIDINDNVNTSSKIVANANENNKGVIDYTNTLINKKTETITELAIDNEVGTNERSNVEISQLGVLTSKLFTIEDRVVDNALVELYTYPYSFSDQQKSFSFLSGVEIFSGISLGNKTISDTNQNYADARNISEELLEQWSTGVRLDILSVMDFDLRSGVKFSMITDRWMETNEYKDLGEYIYVKTRLVDDALVTIDSMAVMNDSMESIIYSIDQYNSQRIISIPVEISFGKSFNKFDLGLGFGIDINYQLKDTHVIKGEDGKAMVANVGGGFVSPSFGGMFLLAYNLNEHWSISSRVNFRGLTLSDHPTLSTLRSKYSLYGLEVGIKYNLRQ